MDARLDETVENEWIDSWPVMSMVIEYGKWRHTSKIQDLTFYRRVWRALFWRLDGTLGWPATIVPRAVAAG